MYVYNLKKNGGGDVSSTILSAATDGAAGASEESKPEAAAAAAALPPLVPQNRKHQAVHDNDTAAVRLLIASGPDGVAKLAEADGDGRGALHWAASKGHATMVGLLLSCSTKAVIDRRDGGGWTPLLSAFSAGHCGAVALLLWAGADPTCRTKGGQTFVHYHKGRPEVLREALEVLSGGRRGEGDQRGTATAAATAAGGGAASFEAWTEEQISKLVNARDASGATALHRCAIAKTAAGALSTGRVLLQFGADPNMRDAEGETPLHSAARYGLDAWIQVLISNGANEGAKNKAGKLPKEVYRKD